MRTSNVNAGRWLLLFFVWAAVSVLHATVSSTTVRTAADGNGTTVAFTFPYLFQSSTDLQVYVRDKTSAKEVLQTFNVSYTVAGATNPLGGTVTFTSPNTPTSNQTVVIVRDPPNTQDLTLNDGQALPASQIEKRLDKLTLEVQFLRDLSNRTIRMTTANTQATVMTLPPPIPGTQFIGFDNSQNVTYINPASLNVSTSLALLSDVLLGTPSTSDVLTYNGTKWTNAPNSGDVTWALSGGTLVTAIGAGKVTLAQLAAAVKSPAQTLDGTRKITTTAALAPSTAGSAGTGIDAAAADHVHPGPTMGVAAGSDVAGVGFHINGTGTTSVSEAVASGVHTITINSSANPLVIKRDSTTIDSNTGTLSFLSGNFAVTDGPAGTVTLQLVTAGITSGSLAPGAVTNAAIVAGAGIPYSKLSLTGSILNADLAGSIAFSKLANVTGLAGNPTGGSIGNIATSSAFDLSTTTLQLATLGVTTGAIGNDSITSAKIVDGTIVNADINGSAAIAYSKLNLTNSVVSGDLAGSIALSKLAANSDPSNPKLLFAASSSSPALAAVSTNFDATTLNSLSQLTLATNGVTYSNLQKVVGGKKLLGNSSASGNQTVAEVGLGTGLDMSGGNLVLTSTGATIIAQNSGSNVDTAMGTVNAISGLAFTNTSAGVDTLGINSGGVGTTQLANNAVTSGKIASATIINSNLQPRLIDQQYISSDGSRGWGDALFDHTTTKPTSVSARGFIPDVYMEQGITTSQGALSVNPYLATAESPVTANVSITNTPGANVRVYNRYGLALIGPSYNVTVGPFAAPGSGQFRNDIVVISNNDGITGALTIRSGSAAAFNPPTDPTLTDTDIPLARVKQWGTTTNITSGMIDDLRNTKSIDGYHLMPATVSNSAIVPLSLTLSEIAASVKSPAQTLDGTRKITTTAALGPGTVGSAGTGVDAAAADHVHPGPVVGVNGGSDIAATGVHFAASGGASVSESISGGVHTITVNAGGSSPNLIVKQGASTIDSSVGTLNFLGGNFLSTSSPAGTVSVQLATSGVTQDNIASNAVTTAKVNTAAITYAKIQNETAATLLGVPGASATAPSEITLADGLLFSGTTLKAVATVMNGSTVKDTVNTTLSFDAAALLVTSTVAGKEIVQIATSGVTQDAIASNAVTTAKVNNAAVTLAKIANASNSSRILGSGSSGSGASYTEMTVDGTLSIGASSLGVASSGIGTTQLAASAVTYAKIQNETAATLLGVPGASATAPSEITLLDNLAFSGSGLKAVTTVMNGSTVKDTSNTTVSFDAAALLVTSTVAGKEIVQIATSGVTQDAIAAGAVTAAKLAANTGPTLQDHGVGSTRADTINVTGLRVGPVTVASTTATVTVNAPDIVEGRISLDQSFAVTRTDVTGSASIYYVPYKGNRLSLYTGSNWETVIFGVLSTATSNVSATGYALSGVSSGSNYDVFGYITSGRVMGLEIGPAWNSDTKRFSSGPFSFVLPTQDGIPVKSTNGTAIDATRRFLGTIRGTGTNTTEDSNANRFVSNYYNRVPRAMSNQGSDVTARTTSNTQFEVASGARSNYLTQGEDGIYATARITFRSNVSLGGYSGFLYLGDENSAQLSGSYSLDVSFTTVDNGADKAIAIVYPYVAAPGFHFITVRADQNSTNSTSYISPVTTLTVNN